jgi:hypothetical protein
MTKKQAFLLVGHANWGKSYTLKALTGSSWKHWIILQGTTAKHQVFVRHMSNSDDPKSFLKFIQTCTYDKVLMAFSSHTANAPQLLQIIQARYDIYCFVLMHSCSKSAQIIPQNEITMLSQYSVSGKVFQYTAIQAAPPARAAALKQFIKQNLP